MANSELDFYVDCFRGFSPRELRDVARYEGEHVFSADDFHTALRTVMIEISEKTKTPTGEVTLIEEIPTEAQA